MRMGYNCKSGIEGEQHFSDSEDGDIRDPRRTETGEERYSHIEDIDTSKGAKLVVHNPEDAILKDKNFVKVDRSHCRDEVITSEEKRAVFKVIELSRFSVKKEVVKNGRCVHFGDVIMVFLIPSRREYKAAGLIPILWWAKSDFIIFKEAAISAQLLSNPTPLHSLKRQCTHSINVKRKNTSPEG